MEYGLLPTEAALSFIIILMITYFSKQQFISTRSKLYKTFLKLVLSYCIFLFSSIMILKYFGNTLLYFIPWRVSHLFFIFSWFTFLFYSYSNIFDIQEGKFFDVVKYNFITKFSFFLMIVFSILFIVPVSIPILDVNFQNDPVFATKPKSIIIMIITVLSVLTIIITGVKYGKKDKRKNIVSNIFCAILAVPFAGMHIVCLETALYPLSLTAIAYIMYFVLENPDIILLAETKSFDKSEEEENKIDFLESLDQDVLVDVNAMISLCDNFDKYNESNIGEFKENVKSISYKCDDFLEKINNVFNASQVVSDNTLNNKKYKTSDLINNIIRYTQEKIKNRNIKLYCNISPTLSSELMGDIEKIEEILKNVIQYCSNVMKLGRITISIGNEKRDNNEVIIFKIIDTSDGLNSDEINNLFLGNNENTQGLKIAKNYVNILNGKIWVQSKYKLGNTFYIQFTQKIVNSNAIDLNEKTIISNFDINADNSKYRVLIVDDNLSNAKITERILKKYKFTTEIINSGNDCIQKIKSEEQYDMIFMDIMMSDLNGVETLNALRDLDGYNLPPIVALTANALSGMKDKYLSDGFDDYMEKPIKVDELKRVFAKFLK